MATAREDLIFNAKLAEQAERYDDMVDIMEKVVDNGDALSFDDKNLLSLAYKNKIGTRRTAWRYIHTIDSKASSSGETPAKQKKVITNYKTQIEDEIRKITSRVVKLIDEKLLPNATTPESKVFYYKMAADYHRYRAEIEEEKSTAKTNAAERSLVAYKTASEAARSLQAYDPVRLGLALNFSVFFYEVMDKPERACQLAKEALDGAVAEMDNLSESEYEDAALVMRLLKDNLALWMEQDESMGKSGDGQLEDLENS